MSTPPKGPYATLYSNYAGVIFQGSAPSPEETEESSIGIQASPSTATEASQTSGESTQSEIKLWEARCRNLEIMCQRLETRAQGAEEREALLQKENASLSKEIFDSRTTQENEKRETEKKLTEMQAQLAAQKEKLDKEKRQNKALRQTLLEMKQKQRPLLPKTTSPLRVVLQAQIPATTPASGQPPAKRTRPDDDSKPGTSQS